MAQYKKTSKVNIPMCAAAILFCLTLISIHLTSGLYSKYVTSASGNDSARVVSFDNLTLTENGDFYEENKLMIIPGVNLNKKAVVDFAGSEASSYVFVEVNAPRWTSVDNTQFQILSGSTPLMSWEIDTGWTFLTKMSTGSYVYYVELLPNVTLEKNIIKDNLVTVSNQITKARLASMTGLTIGFRAAVVQSGGFENAQAAWASVAAKGE